MIRFNAEIPALDPMFEQIAETRLADEPSHFRLISEHVHLSAEQTLRADAMAHLLQQKLRFTRQEQGGLDNLLTQYPLSSAAGQALLKLTTGALRIPDQYQLDRFISEQLNAADWHSHRGNSDSWQINLTTLGLDVAEKLQTSLAAPIIREAVKHGVRRLAARLIIAQDIATALSRQDCDFRYTFDLLGESALSDAEAQQSCLNLEAAIELIGQSSQRAGAFGAGISIKLSALHPKYEFLNYQQIHADLYSRLLRLARLACQYDIGFTIDAEESARQLLTLSLFDRLMREADLKSWAGLGITVQAYLKNALAVVKWLSDSTKQLQRSISVRLVKGAYWHSEIKTAQQASLASYPVWTNKQHTDRSYLACAQILLHASNRIYPQFATHNPFTLSYIHQMAGQHDFEFQAFFGMGESLYQLVNEIGLDRPCRLYAPVGLDRDALPYLIRSFLENGANTSFVHQLLANENAIPDSPPPILNRPNKLFSQHETPILHDLQHWPDYLNLLAEIKSNHGYIAKANISTGVDSHTQPRICSSPADRNDQLGLCYDTDAMTVETSFQLAQTELVSFKQSQVAERISLVNSVAQKLEASRASLLELLVREAGKTLVAAQQEFRQAINYCRYYAQQARVNWPEHSPAPLGIVVVISPYNSPLATLVGQISCALLGGNVVIVKPAPETPLIAAQTIACFHAAGFASAAVQLLPGDAALGANLTQDRRTQAVCFSGSRQTAQKIRQALAGSGATFQARSPGLNAMIVDSSAQIREAVRDTLLAAFDYAGQSYSSLKLLCIQNDIADEMISQLKQAMQSLKIAHPVLAGTQIGPVISKHCQSKILQTISEFQHQGYPVFHPRQPENAASGHYVAPCLIELPHLGLITAPICGPILFIYRYSAVQLVATLKSINQLGYGGNLTIHSNIERHIGNIIAQSKMSAYAINRIHLDYWLDSMPGGGNPYSGTGSLSGGPWALWSMVSNADPCQPHYQNLPDKLEQLQGLAQLWPEIDQGIDLEILFEDAARRSPIAQVHPLPALYGEIHELRYRAHGRVACLGPSEWDLIQQIGIALLTGNQALVANNHKQHNWISRLDSIDLAFSSDPLHAHIDAAMCHPAIAAETEQSLAQRTGALIPLIQPYEDGRWPLHQLVVEYTIQRNITASS
ncbi:bifunctional proline dehydrogenase/L-glutamate gamma-semialdehyde dehydrogenase PutA [Chitinibacter sp. S2-10]|uniref:bifunctional proline dehydrogenase/L-glutamate gamma-semialdehyde dehydrogenase PutA n=1 Tax=Chitinibacter sp. S2-10 TaxID=3373597 RepID=UPI0039779244